MHIRARDIHKDLRLFGTVARWVMPTFTERFLRIGNAFLDRFGTGHMFSNRFFYEQRFLPRADGSTLRVCVCTPKGEKNGVALLWLHGGGYATGIPEQDVGFIRRFTDIGCTVIAPDYRRSDDHPYPAALLDAFLALCYVRDTFPSMRIAVGGDSAGGGLTAALCLYNRDHGDVDIRLQLPLYPMLDDRPTETSRDNDAPVWNSKNNRIAWDRYLNGADPVEVYAAPAREADLSNLPPLVTFVGSIEPFCQETVDYVARMQSCGNRAELLVLDGCFHAFDTMCPHAAPSKEAWAFVMQRFLDII